MKSTQLVRFGLHDFQIFPDRTAHAKGWKFGLRLFRPSRQLNISTSGEERFKYPLPWENKISQMPYPRANKDNEIPTPCPASPLPSRRHNIDRCIFKRTSPSVWSHVFLAIFSVKPAAIYYRFMKILLQKQTNIWSLYTAKSRRTFMKGGMGRESNWSKELFTHPRKFYYLKSQLTWQKPRPSLRKHPFLLALRLWGRFARRNVCDSATEIPYWWRKVCP